MGALFNDMALVHHQNDVGVLDGGEPVGDDKAGAALHQRLKGPLDADFGHRVDRRGRLVENQHRRQAEHNPGDAEQLLLALGEVAAPFGDDGVVALGHPHDETVGVGLFGGGDNLPLGGVRAAVGDVVPDGGRAQPGVLEDHPVALPERLAGKMTDIMAVDRDRTLPDVVEPHQQVNERRLAAAGRADNRDPLAGMDREV